MPHSWRCPRPWMGPGQPNVVGALSPQKGFALGGFEIPSNPTILDSVINMVLSKGTILLIDSLQSHHRLRKAALSWSSTQLMAWQTIHEAQAHRRPCSPVTSQTVPHSRAQGAGQPLPTALGCSPAPSGGTGTPRSTTPGRASGTPRPSAGL